MDPSNKTIVNNAATPPLAFAFLVACRLRVLIYRGRQSVSIEVCRPSRFCQQFEYKQHYLKIIDSFFFFFLSSKLDKSQCVLVRVQASPDQLYSWSFPHVIWWEMSLPIIRVGYIGLLGLYASLPNIRTGTHCQIRRRRGLHLVWSDLQIRHCSGDLPHLEMEGGERGQ